MECSRDDIVTTARKYLGMPYTNLRAKIVRLPYGGVQGRVSCLSFVLSVAVDVGVLPADTDINLDRLGRASNWPQQAAALLEEHCERIDKAESLRGDFFRMKYPAHAADQWHMAIKLTDEGHPDGRIIHALNYDLGGGCVTINRLDVMEWNAIESAWRVKGIV